MPEALIIVDYQNDFTPGGALGVDEGDQIADRLNELAADPRFDLVVATREWHPPSHLSFSENGGQWPKHCVEDTDGAELDPALDASKVDVIVDKGQNIEIDGYSAFVETNLAEILRERGIDSITVCGLATDYCVKNTAIDGTKEGLTVSVDLAASRGVNLEPDDSDKAVEEMRSAGVTVT